MARSFPTSPDTRRGGNGSHETVPSNLFEEMRIVDLHARPVSEVAYARHVPSISLSTSRRSDRMVGVWHATSNSVAPIIVSTLFGFPLSIGSSDALKGGPAGAS